MSCQKVKKTPIKTVKSTHTRASVPYLQYELPLRAPPLGYNFLINADLILTPDSDSAFTTLHCCYIRMIISSGMIKSDSESFKMVHL